MRTKNGKWKMKNGQCGNEFRNNCVSVSENESPTLSPTARNIRAEMLSCQNELNIFRRFFPNFPTGLFQFLKSSIGCPRESLCGSAGPVFRCATIFV